jgi:hypothetical protein
MAQSAPQADGLLAAPLKANFCSHNGSDVYPPLTRFRRRIFPGLSNPGATPDSTRRLAVISPADGARFPFRLHPTLPALPGRAPAVRPWLDSRDQA